MLAWLKLQRNDRPYLSDRNMTRMLCSPLSPHRQNLISIINTELPQEATGLVKDGWQFPPENLYRLINTFEPEFLRLQETRGRGSEEFIGKVVSKLQSLFTKC